MNPSVFIFGRTPDLSFPELQTFFPDATLISAGIGLVAAPVDAEHMIRSLGGTVKIAEIIKKSDTLGEDQLLSVLEESAPGSKITFGISTYGDVSLPRTMPSTLKKLLVAKGYTVRFIESGQAHTLSSVVVSKQQAADLVVIGSKGDYMIGVTRAVQDFEDWNKRDFGRPAPDPKRGMLPPKVARMIVNLGLAGVASEHPMVLDPFCGVGTILAEALLRGCSVTGIDIAEDAVGNAKKNIEWLHREYPQTEPLYASVSVGDATHVRAVVAKDSIDAIVTEPYLGQNPDAQRREMLTPEAVKNILKGLEKLYIGALREWGSVLKAGGRVVMAMPAYDTRRAVMRVKNVVDRCESLGYTLLAGPIEYGRPHAFVRREFYVFQKPT